MRIITAFNLASKSQSELRGLYASIFNVLADPNISEANRGYAKTLLREIQYHLSLKP